MGQNRAAIDIHLVSNGDIVTQDRDILQASPLANGAVPTDNSRLDPSMVLDLAVLQEHTALQTHAIADHNVGTNDYIRANATVLADLGRGINHDVAAVDVRLAVGGQQLGVTLRERGEVEAGARQEIFGLTNIHPETLEIKGVELTVAADGGECLLFDGGRTQLNALENTRVEDVDTGVNAVTNELNWLLDETINARGMVGLVDNDTVLRGLVDLGNNDGALVAMFLVELCELLKGIITDDIGVENEEGRIVLAQNLLCQLQGTSGTEGFGLDGELDSDVVLFLVLRATIAD